MKKEKRSVAVLLHDIRSVHNTGSIFRTADAAGVSSLFLSGYTPSPIDRFGRQRRDFAKVSLGAETAHFEQVADVKTLIRKLKKEGYTVVGIEQAPHSVDYKKVNPKGNILLILGNEVDGIPKDFMKMCDVVAEIPMHGKKESLNVSVAFGVAIFRILNR